MANGENRYDTREQAVRREGRPSVSRAETPKKTKKTGTVRPTSTPTSRLRKKTLRRRIRGKIYVLIAVVALIVALLLALTVFFKVRIIEVHGNTVYTSEEIIAQTGIQYGDNLLLMDKFRVIDRVKENLVFVDDLEIRRSFPNKLVIHVNEVALVVAFDCGDGNYWLADKDGRLLERVTKVPEYAARVSGIQLENPAPGAVFQATESEKQQPMETLMAVLKENDCFGDISDIRIETIYDIRLTYRGRYEVIFGRSDIIADSVAKLPMVADELEIEGTGTAQIDFSDGGIRVIR